MWLILPIPIDLPDEISVKIQAENISLSGLMLTATQEEFEAAVRRSSQDD